MYLMFELRRLDVWPVDDLGVRQGYGLAWSLDPPPTPRPAGLSDGVCNRA
jgi:DNA-3-methyladenine glycosylase II